MRILPVLDLQDGLVVHGVAGRRKEYRPLVSRLCEGSTAAAVARGLQDALDVSACYIADLDAIAGLDANQRLYDEAAAAGFELWIDAGAATVAQCLSSASYFVDRQTRGRTIVGLELLPDLRTLTEAFQAGLALHRTVFSLDLLNGRPLTRAAAWKDLSPLEIADQIVELGIQSLIVLDLAGVGVGQGVPTLQLCRTLRTRYPKLELTSGGGVRDLADLQALKDAGCDAALVASALHDGTITREMLATLA